MMLARRDVYKTKGACLVGVFSKVPADGHLEASG